MPIKKYDSRYFVKNNISRIFGAGLDSIANKYEISRIEKQYNIIINPKFLGAMFTTLHGLSKSIVPLIQSGDKCVLVLFICKGLPAANKAHISSVKKEFKLIKNLKIIYFSQL